jgi:KTSC domain
MTMISLNSSAIDAVGYDEDSRTLVIEFSGGNSYTYYRVPPEKFEGLINSYSPGGYYNDHIKGRY